MQAWAQHGAGVPVTDSAAADQSETLPYAALESRPPRHSPALLKDLWRSVVSTLATTLALRVCYAVITAIGSSFVATHIPFAETPELGVPPVPSILHLVHAAIAALLLAVQFTPFLKPQTIAKREHPIARKCLAQFIAGWRWAWAAWLALYGWLWI